MVGRQIGPTLEGTSFPNGAFLPPLGVDYVSIRVVVDRPAPQVALLAAYGIAFQSPTPLGGRHLYPCEYIQLYLQIVNRDANTAP
jgi:hypothetical protein